MIVVLSPAKTLDFDPVDNPRFTQPSHLEDSAQLVKILKKYSTKKIMDLMHVSEKIAEVNRVRFEQYQTPFELGDAKQAIYAFKGDTYRDLELDQWTDGDFEYAQDHLRILSGLYGLLRPLDLMRPYRLEMGTKLPTRRGKNLYAFWSDRLAKAINKQAKAADATVLVNLASNEYFKSLPKKSLAVDVVEPVFKDFKNGKYKVISFFAKRARGAMAAWIVRERVETIEGLQGFTGLGYAYDEASSTAAKPVFLRDTAAE